MFNKLFWYIFIPHCLYAFTLNPSCDVVKIDGYKDGRLENWDIGSICSIERDSLHRLIKKVASQGEFGGTHYWTYNNGLLTEHKYVDSEGPGNIYTFNYDSLGRIICDSIDVIFGNPEARWHGCALNFSYADDANETGLYSYKEISSSVGWVPEDPCQKILGEYKPITDEDYFYFKHPVTGEWYEDIRKIEAHLGTSGIEKISYYGLNDSILMGIDIFYNQEGKRIKEISCDSSGDTICIRNWEYYSNGLLARTEVIQDTIMTATGYSHTKINDFMVVKNETLYDADGSKMIKHHFYYENGLQYKISWQKNGVENYRENFYYDSNGNLIQYLYTDILKNSTIKRDEFTYDSFGNQKSYSFLFHEFTIKYVYFYSCSEMSINSNPAKPAFGNRNIHIVPHENSLICSFVLDRASQFQLSLYSLSGKRINSIRGIGSAGKNTVSIEKTAHGAMICKLHVFGDAQDHTVRLMVIRK